MPSGVPQKPPAEDWRKRPRKPAAMVKTKYVGLKMTQAQYDAMLAKVKANNTTIVDWIIKRCT